MIYTLIFNIIAVFFAWLESSGLYKHGLKLSLFTVFLFLAIRYDYGNDYMNYLHYFLYINTFSFFDASLFNSIKKGEWGWLYLNRIFGPLGFFVMIAVLAAFTSFILFRFIKKYVPPQYYWFAVFIYVFSPYNMLVLSSAMRQSVAGTIFLLAIDFIIQKKVLKYLILIFIATTFHTSAVFLFPFILLGFVNWQIKFNYILITAILFILAVINNKELSVFIENITYQYFDYYSIYTKQIDFKISIGLGFALNIMIYGFVMYFARNDTNKENNLLYKIVIISLLVGSLGFSIPMIDRLNFYLLPVMMAVFPIIFTRIKKGVFRLGYISIIVLFTFYPLYVFFQAEVWKLAFSEYHTIFSAPQFY